MYCFLVYLSLMVVNYYAPVNYYSFLSSNPKAWELLFSFGTSISKSDTVDVIEVDSLGTPTGNVMSGIVMYVGCNDVFSFVNKSLLVYIIPV